jgi:glycosyltransferase involved in cell wall biosynthesis
MNCEVFVTSLESLITVVIPTHNRAALLAEAIESVLASPLMPSPEYVIVVDDNSTDDTPAVAERYGVRYLRIDGNGPSRTRNAGIALCTTPFVAFLDDDDHWLPGNMERQLEALQTRPETAFAYGRSQMTTPGLEPFHEPYPYPPLADGDGLLAMVKRPPQLGPVLFRHDAILRAGAFDEARLWGEDGDLMVRIAARQPIAGVDFVGAIFRQRLPSRDDAEKRWRARRHFRAIRNKWKRQGIAIPRKVLWETEFELRGQWAFGFCQDAGLELEAGDRRRAARYLWMGLRSSPVHALLRLPSFWTTLAGVVRPRRLARRQMAHS